MENGNHQSEKLTVRELQVLRLICDELSSAEIGERLSISVRTVETHRKNICQKLRTKSAVGLFKYAIKRGLIKHYAYLGDIDQANTLLKQVAAG